MTKPLELTVHPKVGPTWREWTVLHNGREVRGGESFEGYATPGEETSIEVANAYAKEKRLTDAELAAEYWAVATEYTRTSAQVFYEERATGNPYLMHHYKTIGKQQDTMHRFATSSHYCEDDA